MKKVRCLLCCLILLVGSLSACNATPSAPEAVQSSTATTTTAVFGGTATRIHVAISSMNTTTKATTTAPPYNPVTPEDNTPTVPAVAAQYGCSKLLFSDDFDSPLTIDYSGKGHPGYLWYIDRPYGWSTLTTDDFSVADSVLTVSPDEHFSSYSLSTYSKAGNTGFTWKFGYAEARIRFDVTDIPTSAQGRTDYPTFWAISIHDVLGEKWPECGELDVMEVFLKQNTNPNGGVYYGGALHNHVRVGNSKKIGTNLINANGYKGERYSPDDGWHTYAALWTEGYIAWYIDGVRMHSVTFEDGKLPIFRFRDNPDPLPSTETDRNWKGVHTVMNREELVVILGGDAQWPMQVDWVRVWGFPE